MTGSLTAKTESVFDRFEAMLPEALEDAKDPSGYIAAFEAFKEGGLPNRKTEAWKYTDISAALEGPFTRPHSCAYGLLVPDTVQLKMLSTFPTIGNDQPMALLSRALSHSGVELTVPSDTIVEDLVDIDLPVAKDGMLLCPALVINVGANSRVNILINCERQGVGSLLSWIAEINVGENASVTFTKIRTGAGANFCHLKTRQAANSRLTLFDGVIGGDLTRNDLHAELAGEGAEVELDGLYALTGAEHVDNHTTVQHAVPNTASRQLYKGILNDKSHGVFNGRVVVDLGAHGTDALQMNRNLLRSRGAKIDTKPQLEIGNDDVRCSHGATIGRLDELQIFYLESRGLDRAAAEALLARGFAGEVIDQLKVPAVHERMSGLIESYFAREAEDVPA